MKTLADETTMAQLAALSSGLPLDLNPWPNYER